MGDESLTKANGVEGHKVCWPSAGRLGIPRQAWLAVLSVALGISTLMTTELLPVGLLPAIATTQGISVGTAGLVVTAPGVVAAFTAPLLMVVAGRIDRRLLLCGFMALLAMANSASAIAPNFLILLTARVAVGLCIGGFWAIAGGLAVRFVPERSVGLATSLIFGGVSAASVLGIPGGTLIGEWIGWRSAFLVLAILSAAVFGTLFVLLPPLPSNHVIRLRTLLLQFDNRDVVVGLTLTFLLICGQFSAYTYISPALQQIAGVDAGLIGGLLMLYGCAGIAGNFAAGLAAVRNLRRTVLSIAFVLAATVLLLPAFGRGTVHGIVLAGLWGLAYGGVSVSLQTWVLKAAPKSTEAATALFVSVFNLSVALGTLVGGVAADTAGIMSPMWLSGFFFLLATIVQVNPRWATLPQPGS